MNKQKAKYPIRTLLGKYEQWLCIMKSPAIMRTYDRAIERLFNCFPKKTGIEHYTSIDIADYAELRLSKGLGEISLSHELSLLNQFWLWMIEDKSLPLNNPIRAYLTSRKTGVRKCQDLSLTDLNRLLNECPLPTKRYVLNVIQGGQRPIASQRPVLKAAAYRAGLPNFGLRLLKLRITDRLNKDIIQAYCNQLLNALSTEAKPDSNALTSVQISPTYEGSSISDNGYDSTVVGRVN